MSAVKWCLTISLLLDYIAGSLAQQTTTRPPTLRTTTTTAITTSSFILAQNAPLDIETACTGRCMDKCVNMQIDANNKLQQLQAASQNQPKKPVEALTGTEAIGRCAPECTYYKSEDFQQRCKVNNSSDCESLCFNLTKAADKARALFIPAPTNIRFEAGDKTPTGIIRLMWNQPIIQNLTKELLYIIQYAELPEDASSGAKNVQIEADGWRFWQYTHETMSEFLVPSLCRKYFLRVFATTDLMLSAPTSAIRTEKETPGVVRRLHIAKMYYRPTTNQILADVKWDVPQGWNTQDILSYSVTAKFQKCLQNATSIFAGSTTWPQVRHKPDNALDATVVVPEYYSKHACQLLIEIANATSSCGTTSMLKSSIVASLNCEDTQILNYACTTSSGTVNANATGGTGAVQRANFYCFSEAVHYEVVEMTGDEEVALNLYWPQLQQQRQNAITHYWIRYGKIDVSSGVMTLSTRELQTETVDKDATHTVLLDISVAEDYGVQVCAAYGSALGQPNWSVVQIHPIRIERSDISVLCASKVNIEITAQQRKPSSGGHGEQGNNVPRASARITWTLPDGAESLDSLWFRWGLAERTSLPTAEETTVEFLSRTYTRQLKKTTGAVVIDNLQSDNIYGVQICAFEKMASPIDALWRAHHVTAMPVDVRHPELEADLSGDSKVWLYTCIVSMAVLVAVSFIVAIGFHCVTHRGHTITTLQGNMRSLSRSFSSLRAGSSTNLQPTTSTSRQHLTVPVHRPVISTRKLSTALNNALLATHEMDRKVIDDLRGV